MFTLADVTGYFDNAPGFIKENWAYQSPLTVQLSQLEPVPACMNAWLTFTPNMSTVTMIPVFTTQQYSWDEGTGDTSGGWVSSTKPVTVDNSWNDGDFMDVFSSGFYMNGVANALDDTVQRASGTINVEYEPIIGCTP